jgi:CRP/FNR family cyclic AMP-dependent transcriptional regulator
MRKVLFILSELADSDVDWMVRNGTKRRCPPGTVLIEEGKPIEVLYVLLDGRLSVTLAALGGKEVAALQAGEILGELSFLDSRPPSATVTAVTAVTVLSVPRARLGQKLEQDSAFAGRFYRALGVFLASRLRKTQQRLGYGSGKILDDDVHHEDELDPEMLQNLSLAGARFEWMMERLRSAPSHRSGSTGETTGGS